MALMDELQHLEDPMVSFYETIHQTPELAFHEVKTAEYIAGLLEGWGYEVHRGVGKTGVVAVLKNGDGTLSIGFRADMDALPVPEGNPANGVKSSIPGLSHACGHDGHCAMLLGAAEYLAKTRAFNGTLVLVFQPAEETMEGALAMLNDGLLERFPMDAIFGMHNIPGLDEGVLYFREGPLFTAVDHWDVTLTGKGAHGSMPQVSVDPVVAGASLVMNLQTVVSRNTHPMETAVVTVGSFQAGEAGNVIPEKAVLKLSMRSATPETRDTVLRRVEEIVEGCGATFGVKTAIEKGPDGVVTVNDAELTRKAAAIEEAALGTSHVDPDGPQMMFSEDFALYGRRIPACYALLGTGKGAINHDTNYCFNLDVLPVGAAYWVALAEGLLN